MSGFVIRDAVPSDREQIGLMWLYLMKYHSANDKRFTVPGEGSEEYERHAVDLMRSKNARVIVAQDVATSDVVGYVIGEIQARPAVMASGNFGFISDLFVMEEWRSGGLGRSLFEELRKWFVERNVDAIELYVAETNSDGNEFWNKMGLKPFLRLMHLDL